MVAIFNTFKDLHFIGGGPFSLYLTLAISQVIFTADMTTYYCHSLEKALVRAKAGKDPGVILVCAESDNRFYTYFGEEELERK